MNLQILGNRRSTPSSSSSIEVSAPQRKRQKREASAEACHASVTLDEGVFELFKEKLIGRKYAEIESKCSPEEIRGRVKVLLATEPQSRIWLAALSLLIRPKVKVHQDPLFLIEGLKHSDSAVRTVTSRLVLHMLKTQYKYRPRTGRQKEEENQFRILLKLAINHLEERLKRREELKEVRALIAVATDRIIGRQMVVFGRRFKEIKKLLLPSLGLFEGKEHHPKQYYRFGDNPKFLNLMKSGETPLSLAALKEDLTEIEILLDLGANVNQHLIYHSTALIQAAAKGKLKSVKALLNRGADLSYVTPKGCSAFCAAVEKGHVDLVKFLFSKGARRDQLVGEDRTFPLHLLAEMGAVDLATVFADSGADIDRLDRWGNTPLMRAIRSEQNEFSNFLLSRGAKINLKDDQGETLKSHDGQTAFLLAVLKGSLKLANLLIEHKADIEERGAKVRTPLMIAASNRNSPLVDLLLDCGADMDKFDEGFNLALELPPFGSEIAKKIREFGAYEWRAGGLRAERIIEAFSLKTPLEILNIIKDYDGERDLPPPPSKDTAD